MKAVAQLLNEMLKEGIIANYALFGAASLASRHGLSDEWDRFVSKFLND